MLALDAWGVLHAPQNSEDNFPTLAIRPSPVQSVKSWQLKDRTPITLRPISPEDEPC